MGLPLGLALAQAGRHVIALDCDAERVARTSSGKMPFADRGADELLLTVLANGRFRCTTDSAVISAAEVVVTVVGTPLDEHFNPRFEVYDDLLEEDQSRLRDGQLLVLRSTVYPGTTDRVARILAGKGLQIDVAFCPERVAEGYALEEIQSLPQLVAGCNERAQERAEALFRLLTPDIVPMKVMAAELSKLFTNAWRYIQFATANQFYVIANENGIDFSEIHKAMTHKYPRAASVPRAGFAAGPCLLKDTMQLAAFHNNTFFLGHSAMLVNEGLPNYLVQCAARKYDLARSTVGILGMTFKGDSDDPRDSLSFKLRKVLKPVCEEVMCTDPFLEASWLSSLEDTVERCDLLFIGAPHSAYRDLELPKPTIDVWGLTRNGSSVL